MCSSRYHGHFSLWIRTQKSSIETSGLLANIWISAEKYGITRTLPLLTPAKKVEIPGLTPPNPSQKGGITRTLPLLTPAKKVQHYPDPWNELTWLCPPRFVGTCRAVSVHTYGWNRTSYETEPAAGRKPRRISLKRARIFHYFLKIIATFLHLYIICSVEAFNSIPQMYSVHYYGYFGVWMSAQCQVLSEI